MPYELHIEAHTPVGVFNGRAHQGSTDDLEGLKSLRDQMQTKGLKSLVIYEAAADNGVREITLNSTVLERSVLVYEIRETAAAPV